MPGTGQGIFVRALSSYIDASYILSSVGVRLTVSSNNYPHLKLAQCLDIAIKTLGEKSKVIFPCHRFSFVVLSFEGSLAGKINMLFEN